MPESVRVKHGTNRFGKTVHFYLNYSSALQAFRYPYAIGVELLSNAAINSGQMIDVKPWDALIVEEK